MLIPDWLWVISIGALVAGACSLVGCFLVLRRLAMLGDAISHAVLPGIAIAFLLTHSRSSWPMFLGATVLGVVTALLVQVLQRSGRVQGDAAIGVTFTSLFAVGVILISQYAYHVDLDLDCVLYGEIALAPLHRLQLGGHDIGPRAFWQIAAIFALCLMGITLFFKELKITAFDPEMATAAGISATAVHYGLMALVSVTAVGAFEPVGAILVVAMLVVPPATAYLLTDDLKRMLLLSVGCGVLAAALGYTLAQVLDASVAGAMTAVSGALFTLSFLFSPRHGLVIKWAMQRRLSRRVVREDALQAFWRAQESTPGTVAAPLNAMGLAAMTQSEIGTAQRVLDELNRGQLVQSSNGGFVLTSLGQQAARDLVHRHRVYESYLENLGYPEDHLHAAADRAEHFLSPQLVENVDAAIGNPRTDPHGKPIPHEEQ